MLQGTINANRLEVAESGAVIRFERGVTLVIDREDASIKQRDRSHEHGSGPVTARSPPAASGSARWSRRSPPRCWWSVAQGGAQSEQDIAGLFKAHPQKRDEPVKITSATLEVRDKSKMATFRATSSHAGRNRRALQ